MWRKEESKGKGMAPEESMFITAAKPSMDVTFYIFMIKLAV